MSTVTEPLLTADEYARLPHRGVPTELVRGKVVAMNVPAPATGRFAARSTASWATTPRRTTWATWS
jgi:hypothetical protein